MHVNYHSPTAAYYINLVKFSKLTEYFHSELLHLRDSTEGLPSISPRVILNCHLLFFSLPELESFFAFSSISLTAFT